MSEIIYVATNENLRTVIDQIPSSQVRRNVEPLVLSLVERNGLWEFISRWWYPEAVSMLVYPLRPSDLDYQRVVELNRYSTNNISTRTGEYRSIQFHQLSAEVFSQRYIEVEGSSARNILK